MKTIGLDHFKHYRFLPGLKAGGNGLLSVVVKQADMEENNYKSDIWLLEENGGARPLTAGGEAGQHWWLDEETLVFRAVREKKDREEAEKGLPQTLLYKISTNRAGEAQKWLTLEYNVQDIAFLSEEKFLFVAGYSPLVAAALQESESREEALAKIKEERDYEVLEELPFWQNGGGFTGGGRSRLYLYDAGKVRALTDEKTNVGPLRLSPQKRYAYFTGASFKGVMPLTEHMYQVDLASMKVRKIRLAGKYSFGHFACVKEDELVLAASDMKDGGINQNYDICLLNAGSGELNTLYGGREFSMWESVGSDLKMTGGVRWQVVNGKLYWLSTIGHSSQLMTLELATGEIATLTKESGAVGEFVFGEAGIYFTAMRGLGGQEVYCLRQGREEQLTTFNTALAEGYAQYPPEKLSFTNREGREITGWVIRPKGFRAGKKYPAILDIHGGPKTVYGEVAYHEMQYWAACGYGVFFCNPTGGDGAGQDFSDIRGRYGEIDYEDLMAFTDEVLRVHPWVDPARLGVTGGSYGGFMTNWIIGHTNRFQAAASQRSISNWISMTLTTDIGFYFGPDQTASDVWNSHEKMWAQSPLKYANRVKTPTLFIHSDEDYRCWMAEGLQMYTALRMHGVDSRLCLFHGENHELSRSGKPKHRVRRLQEITAWFDKYLKA